MSVETIQDIRRFVRSNPTHPISPAWDDMLFEMDEWEQDYSFDEFRAEAEEQACEGNLSSWDLEQLFGG